MNSALLTSCCLRPLLAVVLALGLIPDARAADFFWRKNLDDTFNMNANWNPGGGPGSADNTVFTNNNGFTVSWTKSITNANAFFNGTNGVVTQAIGGFTWSLTNSYVVGQSNNTTSTVTHISGALHVTNAAGTARLVIGQDGNGTYNLNGGTVLADQLFVTNNGSGFTNSVFNFNSGTLTTLRGSAITNPVDFAIGTVANESATWNILGGTNTVGLPASTSVNLGGVAGATGTVMVAGAATVWTNNRVLTIGDTGTGWLFITNGAAVYSSGSTIGSATTASNNLVRVSGTDSRWFAGGSLFVGVSGSGSQLIIESGGFVTNGATALIGNSTGASNNSVLVTGADSRWDNGSTILLGNSGSGNRLTVTNGGTVATRNFLIGANASALSNVVTVAGGNLIGSDADGALSVLRVGSNGQGTLNFNGGTIVTAQLFVTNNGPGYTNSVFNFNHGTLTTLNGSIITNDASRFSIGNTAGQTATWFMLGGTNTVQLAPAVIALSPDGNLALGGVAGAASVLVVDGPATALDHRTGDLQVGEASDVNLMVVTNGAVVRSVEGYVGNGGANTNTVVVTGAGSTWTNSSRLAIGFSSSRSDQLLIRDGGKVFADFLRLGTSSSLVNSNNAVIIDGAGSVLRMVNGVNVGGSRNLIIVTNGGLLAGTTALVGDFSSSGNHTVAVTGPGSIWTNSSFLNVGFFNASNRLLISDGGKVFNTTGTLGSGILSSNNEAVVTGAGSLWSNQSSLIVGQAGSGNSLTISDNGVATARTNDIGYDVASSNNILTVAGGNLFVQDGLDIGRLAVGNSGSGNLLVVSNGGRLLGQLGRIGSAASARGNTAIVTGSGSTWSNSNDIWVGESGSSNLLIVSNGATAISSIGIIGFLTGSSNNQAWITGPGSLWSNSDSVYVGYLGSGNSLVLSNSGMLAAPLMTIGATTGVSNNVLSVAGGSLVGTNAGGTLLTVGQDGQGTLNFNGGTIVADQLFVTNNGPGYTNSKFNFNYGDLVTTGGSQINFANVSNTSFIIGNTAGQTATWLISGGTNTIAVNGFRDTILGNVAGSRGVVLVTNGGTLWTNTGDLAVGGFGSSNQLTVSGASGVRNFNGLIGSEIGSSNNQVWVTGIGSFWSNNANLNVGFKGSGNLLVVSNGARVRGDFSSVGAQVGANNNLAVVTGAGSVWGGNIGIAVGSSGASNQLWVRDGGVIQNSALDIGNNPTSSNNFVLVADPGSLVSVASIDVGASGSRNQLVISNGAVVWGFTSGGAVGRSTNANGNQAWVTGAGSLWTNAVSLSVGGIGAGNLLVVSNGGSLFNRDGLVGNASLSSNNLVVITGPGSVWSNRLTLTVGVTGAVNQVVITNSGVVAAATTIIGREAGASNNVITVAGGSLLGTNSTGTLLTVGSNGQGTLNFNGGTIVASQLFVTNNGPGYTNSVFNFNHGDLTTLNGSVVTQATEFLLGNTIGQTATWLISGGTNTIALGVGSGTVLGNVAGSSGVVTLTNSGTVWSNSGRLTVGQDGQGTLNFNGGTIVADQLFVTNNGPGYTNSKFNFNYGDLVTTGGSQINFANVSNTSFIIGNTAGQTATWLISGGTNTIAVNGFRDTILGNVAGSRGVVLVTNGGTLWTNTGDLAVGGFGSSNQLTVSGASGVRNFNGLIGSEIGSSNNQVWVTGIGSFWSNNANLNVGFKGSGNLLVVSNGARVRGDFSSVGAQVGANNNLAVVTGAGSVWGGNIGIAVGSSGASNQLWVRDGGVIQNSALDIGNNPTSSNNFVLVADPGSLVSVASIDVGASGSRNQLVISNGAVVWGFTSGGAVGRSTNANGNQAWVTGAGSLWTNAVSLSVGGIGAGNLLVVSNGGSLFNRDGLVGNASLSSNNLVVITGPGSVWSNRLTLTVGVTGAVNQVVITNSGVVAAATTIIGREAGASNNVITVAGGSLLGTNSTGTLLTVGSNGQGTLNFNGGTIVADQLFVTNGANSVFNFNAGTLNVRTTVVANAQTFLVGNGISNATMNLVGGTGTHTFANGLTINTNALLTGNGTVFGTVTNHGTISLGSSPGAITLFGDLRLKSSSMMSFEIGGLIATNDYDQLIVTNFVEFAGTLSLSLLNNFLPAAANTFTLVSFGSSSGSFANVTGGRVSLTNNLASFAVTVTATNLVLGGVQYVDTDGDGQGDLQELAAGTDPNDSNNYLHVLAITPNGSGQNLILFQSAPAKIYRIEYSNDLVAWPVATTNVPSAGTSTQWIDDGTLTGGLPGNQRFYRIGLQP